MNMRILDLLEQLLVLLRVLLEQINVIAYVLKKVQLSLAQPQPVGIVQPGTGGFIKRFQDLSLQISILFQVLKGVAIPG